MKQEKSNPLHQKVLDTISKVKTTLVNNNNSAEEKPTLGERVADKIFDIVGKWKAIFVFVMVLLLWMGYNLFIPPQYRFDPYPFQLMTFVLAGIAAIQAPIIMISQHRQNEKNNKRLALNLKVDNEVMALHQSITVLMEQQLHQVHENQVLTIEILKELHKKVHQIPAKDAS